MSATVTETAKIPIPESLQAAQEVVDDRVEATAKIPVMEKLENACEVVDYGYRAFERARKLCDQSIAGINKRPLHCAAICVAAGAGLGLLAGFVLGKGHRSRRARLF